MVNDVDKQKRLESFLNENYNPLQEKSLLKIRLHKEDKNRSKSRNDYQRDYSRILYSSSFRRLQGKMQLFGVESDSFYRNRLTHSLEVSQIARGIVGRLQDISERQIYKDDLYVIEAASMAHDIGNPPFGHHGERVLNDIMAEHGGFEGNAQTFRVLHKLEKKLPYVKGLNLTKRTLLSVIKYFKKRTEENKDKFLYEEDYELVKEISRDTKVNPRTLDVQIMDLADEIAYGAHDLEDALSLHLFSIDEFLYEFCKNAQKESFDFLEEKVDDAKKIARQASVYESSEEYGFIFRKELVSNIVHELVLDVDVVPVSRKHQNNTGTMSRRKLGLVGIVILPHL